MNISRIAVIASSATLALWVADALTIWSAGGPGHGPLEGLLFLAGFACHILAWVAIGLAVAAGRPAPVRALAAAGVVVAAVLVAGLVNVLVAVAQPADPGWVWGEVNLWVLALLGVGAALWVARRRRQPGSARAQAASERVASGA